MAYVKQRLKTDCGIACLAMLCNVSYEHAKELIDWRHGKYRGTTTKQLREAAWKIGYNVRGTKTDRLKVVRDPRAWKNIPTPAMTSDWWYLVPDNSLVKVRQPERGSGWHWVVWRKQKIYDPARGVFHPSKYGRKPSSYLEFLK